MARQEVQSKHEAVRGQAPARKGTRLRGGGQSAARRNTWRSVAQQENLAFQRTPKEGRGNQRHDGHGRNGKRPRPNAASKLLQALHGIRPEAGGGRGREGARARTKRSAALAHIVWATNNCNAQLL